MTLTASSSRWEDLSVNTTCPRRTGRRATGRSGTTRQPGIEIPNRVLLEARQDVTISVERDRDARMAKALTDNLGVDTPSQEQACVRGIFFTTSAREWRVLKTTPSRSSSLSVTIPAARQASS